MQIQRIQNQPNFKAMHFIQIKPEKIASQFSPEDTQKATMASIINLKMIFAKFAPMLPESFIESKTPEKTTIGLNFPKGFEPLEQAFAGVIKKAKEVVPQGLLSHKMIFGDTGDLSLQKVYEEIDVPELQIVPEAAKKTRTVIKGFGGENASSVPAKNQPMKRIGFKTPGEEDLAPLPAPKHKKIKGFSIESEPKKVAAKSNLVLNA